MRLSEQVAQLEEAEQTMNFTAINLRNTNINLRKEIDRLRLENDQLRCVPMGCYEAACNERDTLKSQLATINMLNETLQKRYEEKINQVKAIEETNTQLQKQLANNAKSSSCKYNFNDRKVIANVNKSNNEIALLELCKSSTTSIQPYVILSVQGTQRFVCLRKEEWEQLVKTYVKEYLL